MCQEKDWATSIFSWGQPAEGLQNLALGLPTQIDDMIPLPSATDKECLFVSLSGYIL